MRFWIGLVSALLLAALVVTLVVRNGQEVTVDLLVLTYPTKLWGAMVAAALVGAAATTFVLAWPLARLKLQTRRHGRRIGELEQELHGLRTLPIANEPAQPTGARKL